MEVDHFLNFSVCPGERKYTDEESSELAKCVSRIWRIYKRQEYLCRSLMRLEIPCRFRCQLGCGYIRYILFRKDLSEIYDQVKCLINDGELSSIVLSNDYHLSAGEHHCSAYIAKLVTGQKELLDTYQTLVCKLDRYTEASDICLGHLEKLSEYSQSLAVQREHFAQSEPAIYFSVA